MYKNTNIFWTIKQLFFSNRTLMKTNLYFVLKYSKILIILNWHLKNILQETATKEYWKWNIYDI